MKRLFVFGVVFTMNFMIASCASEPIEEDMIMEVSNVFYEKNHEILEINPQKPNLTASYSVIGAFEGMDENLEISHAEFINFLRANSAFRGFERPYPFLENGLMGFKDDIDGEVIIEAQYLITGGFFGGLAFVMGVEGSEHKTGYIDESGKLVIPLPSAVWGWEFSEYGFAPVFVREWYCYNEHTAINGSDGAFIFINVVGENVFSQQFLDARRFSEGFARVQLPSRRIAFIDTTGENTFGKEFMLAGDFVDKYANVKLLDGTYTHIDRQGNIVDIDRIWGRFIWEGDVMTPATFCNPPDWWHGD